MAENENPNTGGLDSESPQGNENMNDEFMVSVFKTDNMAIISIVKSILDEAGIVYMAKGDNIQSVIPINAFPVDFQIMPKDEEYSKELLSEIDENSDWYDENSPDDSGEETTTPEEGK